MRLNPTIARLPRKRRLQGALAGFGVGGFWWRALFLWVRLAEWPAHVKIKLHQPEPPIHPPEFPRHEHL